jgi:Holliday junction resolvasome RuvABC endonuclease subunit
MESRKKEYEEKITQLHHKLEKVVQDYEQKLTSAEQVHHIEVRIGRRFNSRNRDS